MKRRVGLEGDDFYVRVVLFEAPRGADEGAARPQARDEVRDLAVGLLPDLRPRALIMRPWVGGVLVLVGVEVLRRVLGVEPPRLPDGPVGAFARIGQDDLDAVGAQDLLPLLARVLGHAQLDLVAQSGPDPTVGDPRVPACGVEDYLPRREGVGL